MKYSMHVLLGKSYAAMSTFGLNLSPSYASRIFLGIV
jgi:hypothetical protein